jgi:hypothetical protein
VASHRLWSLPTRKRCCRCGAVGVFITVTAAAEPARLTPTPVHAQPVPGTVVVAPAAPQVPVAAEQKNVRPLQRGGGVQHCHGRGRPGQVHPGRPVHVQPVPRTVFVGTVRRSSSARSKPSAGAIARPTFFEHLNGGRTCESAMPAFRGPAESGAAPLAAAASTWPLVLSNSTNAPSLARLANAARIAVSTVGPYCWHGLALVERAQSGPAASHYR